MENQAMQTPAQEPVQIPDFQPKPNYLKTIIFSVLILMTLGLITYLFFQNQKLQKQVLNPLISPTIQVPTPESQFVSPTPKTFSSITISPDETENWEIYVNDVNGYSIKYPKNGYLRLICPDEELTITNRGIDRQNSPVVMTTCARGGRYTLETKTYDSIQAEPEETKYYNIIKKDIQIGGIAGKLYIYSFTNIEVGPFPVWYAIANVNKNNKTYEIWFDEKNSLDIFNQILSTFKFL